MELARRPAPVEAGRGAAAGAILLVVAAASALRAQPSSPPRQPVAAISCKTSSSPAAPPALAWQGGDVRWAEWPVALGPRKVRARIVVIDVDPARTRLALDVAQDDGSLAPWNLDAAPADARLALNAGQFTDDGPWGWVVHRGREWQAPGTGTLAGAIVIDTAGAVRIIPPEAIAAWRGSPALREALQSYPMLLGAGGRIPAELCPGSTSLDLSHRDTRLAMGVRRDGHVVIALSRYDGATLPDRTPIGPTTPEMAEIMRRLGAESAVMLDGGLSAQLLVREHAGAAPRQWPGLRDVPLALIGRD